MTLPLPPSLYQQLMGPGYGQLPSAVQQFHALQGRHVLPGWVQVERPGGWAARCLAWCLGAPLAAQQGAIQFELQADPAAEVWTRRFPSRTMQSRLEPSGPHLVERLGTVRLVFALDAGPDRLDLRLVGLRFLGLPCPRWLLPRIVARESGDAPRLHFEVRASLPAVGVVASYRGHLELPVVETA